MGAVARTLVLRGFVITPVVDAVDVDAETIERVDVGQQAVEPGGLAVFAGDTWPRKWEQLKVQLAQLDAQAATAAAAAEPAPANRATKRAAKRTTTAKRAPAKRTPARKAAGRSGRRR